MCFVLSLGLLLRGPRPVFRFTRMELGKLGLDSYSSCGKQV